MKPYRIDDKSEQILQILSQDGKTTHEDIARQLSMKVADVSEIIRNLERDRIILGYKTNINWQRIKNDNVKALIEVRVAPERKVGFDAVAETIYRYPEVTSVFLLSGRYDLLVQVDGDNLREVAQFVSEKLSTIKGVQSTATHFLLKKYKEDGVILAEHGEPKILPVTP